jgi:hypothetical protein
MVWSLGIRAPGVLCAVVCAVTLAGCSIENRPDALAAQPRGASVAFESIDGPPPGQFSQLVENLNSEAQSRRLAVLSRDGESAYRVRGYLAAEVVKGKTTISWVWDVFDRDQHRALRITGSEVAKGQRKNPWAAADDAMLHRIAHASMEQLAAFLTAPEVAPNAPEPSAGGQMALAGNVDSSPEAAGIFRIFQAHADPAPPAAEAAPATPEPVAGPIPLPRRRPPPTDAVSVRDTVTLAASSH